MTRRDAKTMALTLAVVLVVAVVLAAAAILSVAACMEKHPGASAWACWVRP